MAETRTVIKLRYAARCASCDAALPPKSEAYWNKEARTATCRRCLEGGETAPDTFAPTQPKASPNDAPRLASPEGTEEELPAGKNPLERGTPGASAAREWTKRHDRREKQVRDRYGRRLGGLYLAFNPDPQSTQAWAVGNNGEVALGKFLTSLDDDATVIVLHDRRIPRSRANIDHIAVTRNGIHVIDAKNYKGRVQKLDKGGWFSTDLHLYVGRRNCTSLICGMAKQVDAIRAALAQPLSEKFDLTMKPALCFVDAEWSLFAKPFEIDGVWVGWAKALGERVKAEGPLAPEHVRLIAERVAEALPSA